MNDFKHMWDFEVMDGVDFPNSNRVHPLMQKRVQKLLEILKKDNNIVKIVLFGSALEFRCSSYSDIDVYIEKKDRSQSLLEEPIMDCEIDIVANLDKSSKLYQEIEKKGLLLLDRSSNV